jgi:hypothetical protein
VGQKLSVREAEQLVRSLKDDTKISKNNNKNNSKFDFSPLDNIVSKLKDENIKMKVSGDTIKIKINSQDDIETFLKYFSKK